MPIEPSLTLILGSGKSTTTLVQNRYTMPSKPAIVFSTVLAVFQEYTSIRLSLRLPLVDYGNEVESGQGVARAIKEGLVKREDLFLVSKLWNSYHDHDRVEPICKKQLQDWGIDYFDLYIVHFPISLKYVDPKDRYPPGFTYDGKNIVPGNATNQETWTAMEGLVGKGLAKSIGISNFNGALIMDLLRYAKIVPATLQIEHHPYLTQEGLVQYALSQGIAVTAYSSFGPQSFIEMDMKSAKDTPLLFDHPTIKSVADKHGKTPAQVLLRWATQRGIAVIPKSNNPDRLAQNLDVLGWDLDKKEIDDISGLNQKLRFNDPVNVRLFQRGYGVLLLWLTSTCSMVFLCQFTSKGYKVCETTQIEKRRGMLLRIEAATLSFSRSSSRIRIPTSHSVFPFLISFDLPHLYLIFPSNPHHALHPESLPLNLSPFSILISHFSVPSPSQALILSNTSTLPMQTPPFHCPNSHIKLEYSKPRFHSRV